VHNFPDDLASLAQMSTISEARSRYRLAPLALVVRCEIPCDVCSFYAVSTSEHTIRVVGGENCNKNRVSGHDDVDHLINCLAIGHFAGCGGTRLRDPM